MTNLKRAHVAIANALGDLSEYFESGCRLTFIMRDPRNKDSYIVVGDEDDIEELIGTIRKSQTRPVESVSVMDVIAAEVLG